MTIQEEKDGKAVDWMEKISDDTIKIRILIVNKI